MPFYRTNYLKNFYSRASCEARRIEQFIYVDMVKISTHAPHARRGVNFMKCRVPVYISTHAPHARRGLYLSDDMSFFYNFYSRASCEARLAPFPNKTLAYAISTHAPHTRRGENE